jgi:hypothetical protein
MHRGTSINQGIAMSKNLELNPLLREFYRQVEEIKRVAEDLVEGLSEEQFNWRQDPERWSINECLEHLNVTARLYWSVLAEAVSGARIQGWFSKGPYKHTWIGPLMISSMEPPVRIRFKSPRSFRPPDDIPMNQVIPQFMAFQDRLLGLIRDANGVDLGRPRVHPPGNRMIKITLGEGIGLMTAHERRHLWQARMIMVDKAFPK